MKKLLSLMIAAIMLLSLAACGETPASSAAETDPPETSAPKTENGRPVIEVTTVDELLSAINTGAGRERGAVWYAVGRYVYVPLAVILCCVALFRHVAF